MCERVNLEFNRTLKFVRDKYKTRKMLEKAAVEDSDTLDIFLTDIRPDSCEKELQKDRLLESFPDKYKSKETYSKAVHKDPYYSSKFYPNRIKTQQMCNEAVKKFLRSLMYVPDFYVMLQKLRYEYYQHLEAAGPWLHDDLVQWCNSYKQRKGYKEEICNKLLPITWNSTRQRDCWEEKDQGNV